MAAPGILRLEPALWHRTTEIDPRGDGPGPRRQANLHDYQYDDAGNVTSVWDASSQYTFQYDDLNQLTWAYDKSYAYDQAGRFTQFAGQAYAPDPNHPHAVRQVNGSVLDDYDQNGNMIARYDWGGALPLEWDSENRLVRIGNDSQGGNNPPPGPRPGPYRVYLPLVVSNPVLEKYTYDGDGNRVRKYTRDATTYYIAPHYEVTVSGGQTKITKYYAFNGQRVAMRLPDGNLHYLHTDHLGSTVAATDALGEPLGNNQPRDMTHSVANG